jgi:hypothetical protein
MTRAARGQAQSVLNCTVHRCSDPARAGDERCATETLLPRVSIGCHAQQPFQPSTSALAARFISKRVRVSESERHFCQVSSGPGLARILWMLTPTTHTGLRAESAGRPTAHLTIELECRLTARACPLHLLSSPKRRQISLRAWEGLMAVAEQRACAARARAPRPVRRPHPSMSGQLAVRGDRLRSGDLRRKFVHDHAGGASTRVDQGLTSHGYSAPRTTRSRVAPRRELLFIRGVQSRAPTETLGGSNSGNWRRPLAMSTGRSRAPRAQQVTFTTIMSSVPNRERTRVLQSGCSSVFRPLSGVHERGACPPPLPNSPS